MTSSRSDLSGSALKTITCASHPVDLKDARNTRTSCGRRPFCVPKIKFFFLVEEKSGTPEKQGIHDVHKKIQRREYEASYFFSIACNKICNIAENALHSMHFIAFLNPSYRSRSIFEMVKRGDKHHLVNLQI